MVSYNDILPGFNHKVQGCRWLWNMVPNSHYRLRGPMQEIQVSLYTDRAGSPQDRVSHPWRLLTPCIAFDQG